MIESDFSRVRRKKSGELWSTNNTVLQAHFDPPKSTFLEDHISAPRGRCWLKFLHALENDQGLLAHTPRGTRVPPTIFNNEDSKIGLKFGVCAPYLVTCREAGMITWVQFLGNCPLKIWEGKNRPKYGVISRRD